MDAKRAAQEILKRKEARNSLISFIKYMRPSGLPDFEYIPAAHHILIAEILQELAEKREDRAAISLPPGSAKSVYCSIWFPCWLLARNPKLKIICVSNSETLAEDFSAARRRIFSSEEWMALSGTSLLADTKSLAKQFFPEGGGIYAVGAGTTITGKRADYLIGDDLITGHEQASSLHQLDKLWNWYLTEARSRIKPDPKTGEEGVELMIATRWHLRDPIGRVMKLTQDGHENWHYVKVPMICNSDDDPLGRRQGDRLWPTYFTQRMVADARRSPLMWATLYQQEPTVSEHAWVSTDHLRIHDVKSFPKPMKFYIGCDIALSIQRGDWTVFSVVGIDVDKSFYLVDLWRRQADPSESSKALVAMCTQYEPVNCWVENDNASKVWARLVSLEARNQGINVPLMMSRMKNNDKEVRAAPLRGLFMQDRVTIAAASWTEAVLTEIAEFPAGRHDDIIDSFGVVAKELHRLSAPRHAMKRKKAKPIQGSMQIIEGRQVTRATVKEMFALNAGRRKSLRI